jgi:hypothetical protein
MTHRDLQKSSGRGAGTPGHTSNGGKSVAAPKVVDLAEARERLDGGKRTALAELLDPTNLENRFDLASDAIDREEEFNRELVDGVLTELSEIRSGYIHAMKYLDYLGDRLAHVAIGERVNSLDDLRDVLKERWSL